MCYYKEIIKEIASKTDSDGRNVRTYYRGENKKFNTVSSKLYRYLSCLGKREGVWNNKSDDEKEQFLFSFEKRIIGYVKRFGGYAGEDYSLKDRNCAEDFSSKQLQLLADVQHRGGMTNFIDFTMDVNIALFVACYNSDYSLWKQHSLRYSDEDGRVVLYRHIYSDIKEPEHDVVMFPEIAYSRMQSSVLVRPKTYGVIDIGSDFV
ncbi:MAG: FRG domain-containing protein, partial [Gemmatimonadetes bacterium]|nr:FRG domain-containing protein [Gemmatimonadota bacterium]